MSTNSRATTMPPATAAPATQVAAPWHTLSPEQSVAALVSSADLGLTETQAAERLAAYGPNELRESGVKPWYLILLQQFTSVMVLILIAAAVLSLFLGKFVEAIAILAIVVLFGFLGFYQEYRAEKAIAALRSMAVPSVRVTRGGVLRELPASEVVPGDLVSLEPGNIVPADARILSAASLRVQESALTGESEPVDKVVHALPDPQLVVGDRRNMVYMGSQVAYGRATVMIAETGMNTELGHIATLIQNVEQTETPLQKRLDRVGKQLALAGIVVAILIMIIGVLSGETWGDMLLTAISVAVAVIPEGLPAVVTFTLAIGAQRMLKRNALIRTLPAVETLGSVTTICSDKTGTLTENRMTVTVVDVAGDRIDVTERIRHHQPALEADDIHPERLMQEPEAMRLLLTAIALNNDARLQQDDGAAAHAIGDPTEGALLIAVAQFGLNPTSINLELPRLSELPFDSDRKRMTTIHRRPQTPLFSLPPALADEYLSLTKGSVDGLLDISTHVFTEAHLEPMSDSWREHIEQSNAALAQEGMRVIGVALRTLSDPQPEGAESQLAFLGLVGMIDPPRPEVRDAVAECAAAGIRPVMITGDHPLTASAIARDLGIMSDSSVAISGAQINVMSDTELDAVVEQTSVFARVSPEHKLRIVDSLQRKGHVVAMTGDGVNDAPALRSSNIGVAMGITGTDVTKEAADMVLRDDNFATIVAAVEEGRVVYDNLRRFIKFAVAGNLGKILVMLLWPVPFLIMGVPLSDPVALLPLQLLWLNLLTDGLLGLSMGAEPAEPNVMQRSPQDPAAGMFSGGLGWQVLWIGSFIGIVTLAIGFVYYNLNLPEWQTMMFVTLASMQLFQAWASRSDTESVFKIGLFSNAVFNGMALLVIALQAVALYAPVLSDAILETQPITAVDLSIAVAAGVALFALIELEKWSRRIRSRNATR